MNANVGQCQEPPLEVVAKRSNDWPGRGIGGGSCCAQTHDPQQVLRTGPPAALLMAPVHDGETLIEPDR